MNFFSVFSVSLWLVLRFVKIGGWGVFSPLCSSPLKTVYRSHQGNFSAIRESKIA